MVQHLEVQDRFLGVIDSLLHCPRSRFHRHVGDRFQPHGIPLGSVDSRFLELMSPVFRERQDRASLH